MEFKELSILGLYLVTPKVFGDGRGFFKETYNTIEFKNAGIDIDWVQDNHSRSLKNVLRGLHYQRGDMAQDKLVRVARGKVLDVAVDLRKGSPTFSKYEKVELTDDNHCMFFIPKGFAHGFLALSDIVDFEYKVSNFYSPEDDRGIMWNDPDINIDWDIKKPLLSEKDTKHPFLKDILGEDLFIF